MKKFFSAMIVALCVFATSGLFSSCGGVKGNAEDGYEMLSVVKSTADGIDVSDIIVDQIARQCHPLKTKNGKWVIQEGYAMVYLDDIDYTNKPGYKAVAGDYIFVGRNEDRLYFIISDTSLNSTRMRRSARDWLENYLNKK